MIKNITRYVFLTAIFIYSIGCENTALQPDDPGEEEPIPGVADIRFIHSASSTDELDVLYLNTSDNKYYALQDGAAYGYQYGYYSFYSRDLDIAVVTTNTDIMVSQVMVPLKDDHKYSIIAHDYEATIDPKLMILNDTLATADSGYSYVRFVHAGTDAEKIIIKELESTQSLVELPQFNHSVYKQMEARTYKFEISLSDTGKTIKELDPLTFISNQNYTVILSGSVSGMTKIDLNAKLYRETSL